MGSRALWWTTAAVLMVTVSASFRDVVDVNGETETLAYYIHCTDEVAIVAGPGANGHDLTALKFGSTLIFDNDVTEGPELTSKRIGRREGMAFKNNFDGANYYLLFTIIFEHHGKYNGTLQVQGTEIGSGDREISVVGGTVDFRGARGYSTFHLHSSVSYPIIKQNFVLYKSSFNYKPSVTTA